MHQEINGKPQKFVGKRTKQLCYVVKHLSQFDANLNQIPKWINYEEWWAIMNYYCNSRQVRAKAMKFI